MASLPQSRAARIHREHKHSRGRKATHRLTPWLSLRCPAPLDGKGRRISRHVRPSALSEILLYGQAISSGYVGLSLSLTLGMGQMHEDFLIVRR